MQLQVIDGLPFISVRAIYQGAEIDMAPVLVDTGSAESSFSIDALKQLGIEPGLDDKSTSSAVWVDENWYLSASWMNCRSGRENWRHSLFKLAAWITALRLRGFWEWTSCAVQAR